MSSEPTAQGSTPTEAQAPPWLKMPDSAKGYPHTVTFYSFKGGVGRTLALLNVAVFLARKGNRVCIADFDLEAPGVDSYAGFEPPTPDQPGIVEFVSDYLADPKLIAPSCAKYIYPVKLENARESAALWVMRAGRQDAAYREKLSVLDWNKLFEKQDGLPLFDNLKGELFDEHGCNFLLLDSRTGLTDVGGLCTGILPDAVILMFYPDEQNRRGIETVAKAIRSYAERNGRRVDQMFCVSRVPQIDSRVADAWKLAFDVWVASRGNAGLHHYGLSSEDFQDRDHRDVEAFQADATSLPEFGNWNYDEIGQFESTDAPRTPGCVPLWAFDLTQLKVWYAYDNSHIDRAIEGELGGVAVCMIPEHLSGRTEQRLEAWGSLQGITQGYSSLAAFSASGNPHCIHCESLKPVLTGMHELFEYSLNGQPPKLRYPSQSTQTVLGWLRRYRPEEIKEVLEYKLPAPPPGIDAF